MYDTGLTARGESMSEQAELENQDAAGDTAKTRPDYDLVDVFELSMPGHFKALGDPLRQKILGLLSERAATTSQLAEAFGSPAGTMGHHLQVLVRAGLIHVVRTRQVRAMTEKYYGRVARVYMSYSEDHRRHTLEQAMREYVPMLEMPHDVLPLFMLRHTRIPESKAREFAERLMELGREFSATSDEAEKVYGLLGAVYLTDWPALPKVDD